MAQNERRDLGDILTLPVVAAAASGDPVAVPESGGGLVGVCLTDRDADGNATVKMRGVFDLSVQGHDGSSDAAIAVGDPIYYTAASTPKLDVDTSGTLFGYAVEAVTSGATATIEVRIRRG